MHFCFVLGELESIDSTLFKPTTASDLSEAKKKMVRFGRGEGASMEEDTGWSEGPVKDSGIDTGLSSSNQTLNDDLLKVILTCSIPAVLFACYSPDYYVFSELVENGGILLFFFI